jgi:hypothetical protein
MVYKKLFSGVRGKLILNFSPLNISVLVISIGSNEAGGPGSSVGIGTGNGLDGLGSNPGRGEIFRTCPDRPWGPPSLLYNGFRVFPGGRMRPGRDAHPSPLSSAVV